MANESAGKREMLRHTLATLAYRGSKALRGAPAGFAEFKAFPTTRTPGEILAHMGDLLDWGLSIAQGREKWKPQAPGVWAEDVARWHAGLAAFDAYLASDAPLHATVEGLFQGPSADSLNHVGQISLLRRMHGAPVKGENYNRADIVAGRVGAEQSKPKVEFE
jgi:hypothetical protein